jgi:hypothetical protein
MSGPGRRRSSAGAFAELNLSIEAVRRRLGLYPWPWTLIFEKRMHFILRLAPPLGTRRAPAQDTTYSRAAP